jgi:holliday junction DNA helicase RuvA
MIGSLRGTVIERGITGEALIEVQGVGYRVNMSPRTLGELRNDTEAFLHIHHHIREDAQTLYGFTSRDDRLCFEALIGAHGVGPALAMAILGVHTPDVLRTAVATGDDAALCLVPGVGKKTAARLLIELKSRLDVPDYASGPSGSGSGNTGGTTVGNVREALTGLGYGAEEIRDVLRDIDLNGESATVLREALARLGSRRA